MKSLRRFYDRYHQKNSFYSKVINRQNFTYFYILDFLHQAYQGSWQQVPVLDVGCGVGTVALYLGRLGANVVGLDVSPRAIKIAQSAQKFLHLENVEFREGELQKGLGQFQVVLCTEVIEHIQDDRQFLDHISSHLAPGGVVLLTTPSSKNWMFKVGMYNGFDEEVGHLRRYTEEDLSTLIEQSGLEVFKIRSVESLLRSILFTTRLGFLIRFIRGPLVPAFHFFDEVVGRVAGGSDIQVIARKKYQ